MLDNLEDIPLFYNPQSIIKTSGKRMKLADNPKQWGQQILDALYSDHPQLNGKDIQLHWTSQDEKSGNGVGRVTMDGKAAFPVLVENYKMAPLDTFVAKGHAYRASPKRLKELGFTPELFDGVIKPRDEKGLMPDMPTYRSTGVNSFDEGRRIYASILDKVLPYASKADLEKFAHTLSSDPQIGVNYAAYGNQDIVAKIMGTKPVSMEKQAQDLTGRMPVSVAQFRMFSDGQLFMKVASDLAYDPQEVMLTPDKFRMMLSKLGKADTASALRKAASPEGYTLVTRGNNVDPVLVSDMKEAQPIQKFGFYLVKDVHGKEHRGWVFPQTYTLEDKTAQDKMLFIGEKARVSQDQIAGVSLYKEGEAPPFITDIPTQNDVGCFVFESGGNGIAFEPMKIRAIEKTAEGPRLTACNALGVSYIFHMSKKAREFTKVGHRDYLLPYNAHYASLREQTKSAALIHSANALTKTAAADLSGNNYCRLVSIAQGKAFLMNGPAIDKMGSAGTEQNPSEVIFKLACMGLSSETAEKMVNKARAEGEAVISGLRDIVPMHDVTGHEKQAQILQVLASLPMLKQDMTKICADIKDPEILDRVLSLNFLNPQNIGVLVDHMDDLEATNSRLSEMLIAARLGAGKDLNEDAIVQARQALDDTVDGLSNLKSRLGPQTNRAEIGGDSGE